MNTKQIIAVLAIVAVAAAAVAGTAYAYQATLTNTDNDITSNYLALDASEFAGAFDNTTLQYNSVTTAADTATYTPTGSAPIAGTSIEGEAVNGTAYALKVNSTQMQSTKNYTLQVTTLYDSDDEGTAKDNPYDMKQRYAIVVDNGTAKTATILSGTSPQTIYTSATGIQSVHTLNITVVALEFTGKASTLTDPKDFPGISAVDFKFEAIVE